MSSSESSSSSSQESESQEEDANCSSEEEQSPSEANEPEENSDRRARAEAQWPTDKIVVTAIAEDGMPIPKREKQRMRKLAGLIARQKVSLLLPNFASLKKQGKQILFDDYVMPSLEFNDEMKEKGFKRAMKAIAKCWRNHKSKLVNEYMLKNRSPFQRFKFLKKDDWEAFVKLKSSDEFQQESDRFKGLRGKNKHPHRLGTAGYEGKIEVWKVEDEKLAMEGRPNPWLQFPGRAQNWLRARGTLTETGEISFKSQETKDVSDKIKELSKDSSCSGQEDALSTALGTQEHPGRVRGVSSFQGWKIALPGYKRKRFSEDCMQRLAENLRDQITQDIIANMPRILEAQGLKIVPISASPLQRSPVDARRSSCSSIDAPINPVVDDLDAEMMQHESHIPQHEPDSIDLLSEPTSCSLMAFIEGYQVEVARGQVHPQQIVLHCVQVHEDFAVVFVDFVHAKFQDKMLERPPNDETITVGDALLQRVQWRRCLIVINPTVKQPSNAPPRPPLGSQKPSKKVDQPSAPERTVAMSIDQGSQHDKNNEEGKKAKSSEQCSQHDNNEEGKKSKKAKYSEQGLRKNVPSSHDQHEKAKTIDQASQHDKNEEGEKAKKKAKSSDGIAKCCNKAGDINTQSKILVRSVWTETNTKFKYGKPLISSKDLKKAGPSCISLHNYYLNGCKEKKKNFFVYFRPRHLLRREGGPFIVDFGDLYDLFNVEALDMSILRTFTLYMFQEARKNNWPVVILDPQMMALPVIQADHDEDVKNYAARAMTHCAKMMKEFVMFPCNTGGHWIAVLISIKWSTVWYMDSVFDKDYDITILTELLDKAFSIFIASDPTRKRDAAVLKHITKSPCHQQQVGNACGFYCAHHMLFVAAAKNLTKPEDLSLPTCPIDDWALSGLRERMATFLVAEVISPKGEFHLSGGATY